MTENISSVHLIISSDDKDRNCVCVFLCSIPHLGELQQCALGDKDPGRFHRGQTPRSGSHHRGRTRSNL